MASGRTGNTLHSRAFTS